MKRIHSFLLATVYVFLLLTPAFSRANAAPDQRYGYTQLQNDAQRTAYKALSAGIAELKTSISFTAPGATGDDIQFALNMMYQDYPEYYWFDRTAGCGMTLYSNGEVIVSAIRYSINGQTVTAGSAALANARNAVNAAIAAAKARLPAAPSNYDIALIFHDYLVDNVSYYASADNQTAYGALVTGQAVCAGYARAYQLLMLEMGINCWYVTGQSYDPGNTLVNHGWNLVWLDGKCYYTDVTWDDQEDETFHEYLNLSREQISTTHFTNDPIPASCAHEDYTFFVRNDGAGVCDIRVSRDAADVAGCFIYTSGSGENTTFCCTIHYHTGDFFTWWNENQSAIVQKIGITGSYTVNTFSLGMEYHITVTGTYNGSNPEPPVTTQPPAQTPSQTDPPAVTHPPETDPPAGSQTPTDPPATKETDQTSATLGASDAPADETTDGSANDATQTPSDGATHPAQTDASAGTAPQSVPQPMPVGTAPMVFVIIGCGFGAAAIAAVVIVVIKKRR